MPNFAKAVRATVIPCLRYRDAPAAIEWLCSTFGFEKQLVVPNDDGTIAHAATRVRQRDGHAGVGDARGDRIWPAGEAAR